MEAHGSGRSCMADFSDADGCAGAAVFFALGHESVAPEMAGTRRFAALPAVRIVERRCLAGPGGVSVVDRTAHRDACTRRRLVGWVCRVRGVMRIICVAQQAAGGRVD